jgi:hypothetical protein
MIKFDYMPEYSAVPIERRHVQNRLSLSNIIEQISDGSYESIATPETLAALTPKPDHFDNRTVELQQVAEFWEETGKPERLALTSILINAVWHDDQFQQARDNFTPIEDVRLDKQMGDLFMQATVRVLGSIKADPNHPHYLTYTRLKTFTDWSDAAIFKVFHIYAFKNNSPEQEIIKGIYTAQHVAWGLIDIFVRKMQEKNLTLTNDQTENILKRAFRNIGIVLASLHKDITVEVIAQMSSTDAKTGMPYYLIPEYFDLVKDTSKPSGIGSPQWTLIMNPTKAIPVINDAVTDHNASTFQTTTRCPAMYGIGDHQPPITEYLQWILTTALKFAPELHKSP